MIRRWISKKLISQLQFMPSVALLGPRQVGKTTLARQLLPKKNVHYLDLESPADQLKITDPLSYFERYKQQLIILDEIQRMPDLFQTIRGVIDQRRLEGQKHGHFLFLGSASMELLRQSSESLAGRISYLYLGGFSYVEVRDISADTIQKLWFRGGFPESFLAHQEQQAMQWLENMLLTYVERDLPQFGIQIPSRRILRFWHMLAHLQGEIINKSQLATNLEVDAKTVSNYLDLMEDLLLIRRINPWHGNGQKRLIKSPRYYIRDSGMLHQLLRIPHSDDLFSHPILGKSWEGFVIEQIHLLLPSGINTFFYRTSHGAEADLVIEWSHTERWVIEIKFGKAPKIKPSFYAIEDELNASEAFVIYGGEDRYPLKTTVDMISLADFLQLLEERGAGAL